MARHEHFEMDGIDCYMYKEEAEQHREEMHRIVDGITDGLADHPNFRSVSFTDVSGHTIQVDICHKQIRGYTLFHVELQRDWSNIDEVISEAVNGFVKYDTMEHISSYQKFLADGEKYGWD